MTNKPATLRLASLSLEFQQRYFPLVSRLNLLPEARRQLCIALALVSPFGLAELVELTERELEMLRMRYLLPEACPEPAPCGPLLSKEDLARRRPPPGYTVRPWGADVRLWTWCCSEPLPGNVPTGPGIFQPFASRDDAVADAWRHHEGVTR